MLGADGERQALALRRRAIQVKGKALTFNRSCSYSNSTGSSVTNCRFSPTIALDGVPAWIPRFPHGQENWWVWVRVPVPVLFSEQRPEHVVVPAAVRESAASRACNL